MKIKIFSAVLLLFSFAASSTPTRYCSTVYRELAQPLKQSILTENEEKEIHRLFSDKKIDSKDAAEKAFEIVFQARLRLLDPQDKKAVEDFIQSDRIGCFPSGGLAECILGTHYHPFLDWIMIFTPNHFRRTAFHFGGLIHELEHVIQTRSAKRRGASKLRNIFFRLPGSVERETLHFEQEAGAMISEWQYLHSLPRSYRKRLSKEIEQDETLSNEEKKLTLRQLENAWMSADNYLKQEHEASRYNQKQFKNLNMPFKILKVFYGGVAAAGVTLGITTAVCNKSFDKDPKIQESDWFKKVCLPLAPVKNHIAEREIHPQR